MVIICLNEIFACLLLSILYVGSLYIWNAAQGRDHPSTIKKRCISVFFMTIVSPFFIILFGNAEEEGDAKLWSRMGLRLEGIVPALILPLVLTFTLFLGPLVQSHLCIPITSTLRMYLDPQYWYHTAQNPIWWRNQVVAPFSEEFTFRACMLPILLQCFPPGKAIFIAPLFFGVAHLHHAVDRIRVGIDLTAVILISCFQFVYTSIFGFYSSFLFVRTGHFLPLFAVHAFCNHMGLPELKELWTRPAPLRNRLMFFHVVGLVSWYFLLYPLTDPSYYGNTLYSL